MSCDDHYQNNDFSNSGVSGGWVLLLTGITTSAAINGNTMTGASNGIKLNSCTNLTIGATSGDIQVGSQLKEIYFPLEINSGSNITVSNIDFGRTTSGGAQVNLGSVVALQLPIVQLPTEIMVWFFRCSNVVVTNNNLTDSGVSGATHSISMAIPDHLMQQAIPMGADNPSHKPAQFYWDYHWFNGRRISIWKSVKRNDFYLLTFKEEVTSQLPELILVKRLQVEVR